MAIAKSKLSVRADALEELVAAIGDCESKISSVASGTWGANSELTLHMVARVLCEVGEKLDDIQSLMRIEARESVAHVLHQRNRALANDEGSPLGEIVRSGGVAMKNALELPPSRMRDIILLAAANILNGELLAPEEEGLSDWTEERKRVAAM